MPLRSAFTKTFSAINNALNDSSPDFSVIVQLLNQLDDESTKLHPVDEDILNIMLESNISERKIQFR